MVGLEPLLKARNIIRFCVSAIACLLLWPTVLGPQVQPGSGGAHEVEAVALPWRGGGASCTSRSDARGVQPTHRDPVRPAIDFVPLGIDTANCGLVFKT